MKTYKLAIGITSLIAVGIVVCSVKKNRLERRFISVSDAGYETAYDILFPLKSQQLKKRE
ncbi:MAG TPA: hypothetical protein VN958_14260 [Chitinophagaceae bacterium]|nr:hypothetical protein [Chitinophagaceae bacterium]